MTEATSSVTWTATPAGGGIAPGSFDEFELTAGPLPTAASVAFPVLQTYADGSTVSWSEPTVPGGSEPDHPAPSLTLAAAAAPGSDTGGTGATRTLAIIGVALGALGLGAGGLSLGAGPQAGSGAHRCASGCLGGGDSGAANVRRVAVPPGRAAVAPADDEGDHHTEQHDGDHREQQPHPVPPPHVRPQR